MTIKGTPINDINHKKNGMVMDFSDIKTIVKEEIIDIWDHAVLINANSPHMALGEDLSKARDNKGSILRVSTNL